MGRKRADEELEEYVDPSVLSAVGSYNFTEYSEPKAGQPLMCKRPIGFDLLNNAKRVSGDDPWKPRKRVKAKFRRIV